MRERNIMFLFTIIVGGFFAFFDDHLKQFRNYAIMIVKNHLIETLIITNTLVMLFLIYLILSLKQGIKNL